MSNDRTSVILSCIVAHFQIEPPADLQFHFALGAMDLDAALKAHAPPPTADNDRILSRLTHRFRGVEAIRRSSDYLDVIEICGRIPAYPGTFVEPNPANHASVSKRQWEDSVQEWRRHLTLIATIARAARLRNGAQAPFQ